MRSRPIQKVRGVFAALGGLALLQSGQSGAHAGSASRLRAAVPEARARVADELTTVHVVACDGPGENGDELYVYEDTSRATFRIGRPGWAGAAGFSSLFSTLEEAIAIGCTRR